LRGKAKMVEKYVEGFGERLELHPLPTYAPDVNPDEFVWSYMKNNGVSKKPLKKDESLRKGMEEDLLMIQFNRPLVRSFFRAKIVAYAAD
jgi:transposase